VSQCVQFKDGLNQGQGQSQGLVRDSYFFSLKSGLEKVRHFSTVTRRSLVCCGNCSRSNAGGVTLGGSMLFLGYYGGLGGVQAAVSTTAVPTKLASTAGSRRVGFGRFVIFGQSG